MAFIKTTAVKSGNIINCKTKLPSGSHAEITPSFFKVDDSYYMIITTGFSVLCPFKEGKSPKDLFFGEDALDVDKAYIITDSETQYGKSQNGGDWIDPENLNGNNKWQNGNKYWKRQYYGIFSSHPVTIGMNDVLINILHGENKNERHLNGNVYLNNIQKKRDYLSHEFSGPFFKDGQLFYDDYSGSYFAFISLSVIPVSKISNRFDSSEFDQGPVVWPTAGYLDNKDIRINTGLRHPGSIVYNNYLYLFYLDNSKVRVARLLLTEEGLLQGFKGLRDGEFCATMLPDEFDKNERFYFCQGIGDLDEIISENCSIKFDVAKIKGMDYFIGIEEYEIEWPSIGLRFRFSSDLINWEHSIELPETIVKDYNDGHLHYPRFFNDSFTSCEEIDLGKFYLIGVSGNNKGAPVIECKEFSILKEEIVSLFE